MSSKPRGLLRSGMLVATGALLSCGQLTATWNDSSDVPLVIEPYGRGETVVPDASADGGGGGSDDGPLPHPMGCGDRRGPGIAAHDTLAECPLPQADELETAGGTLPAGTFDVPPLVLGDDVLLVSNGSLQASLFDLYEGREKLSLTLADGFFAPNALADDQRICLIVGGSTHQLQCFDRELGTSLWQSQLSFAGVVEDMLIRDSTLWLQYSNAGFGELIAVNLVTGRVLWRHTPLVNSGRLVRVGDELVGYDEGPCTELETPGVCLHALDAATGETRATQAAQLQHFVWNSAGKALFSDGVEFFEYDARSTSFSSVTDALTPFVTELGSVQLNAVGEALTDGRVLVSVRNGPASELVVVDPSSFVFKKLGIAPPRLLRVHGDLLVADGQVVSLTDSTAPAEGASTWFGIFGFSRGSETYARKVQ
ncbi:MAG: PQQ-binding-like beta-propeller repeat protein [Pseudomonadota bacterium]